MSIAGQEQRLGGRVVGVSPDMIAIAAAVALAVLAMVFLATGRSQDIRRAASGFDGLGIWLADSGLDAQIFAGGFAIPAEEVGLSILPLYDTALDVPRVPPATQEELLLQRDEVDLAARVLTEKARMAPALVILPKWRSGMRLTGLAHPVLLIGGGEMTGLLADTLPELPLGRIRHIAAVENRFDYTAAGGGRLVAELYVAQVFEGSGCTPVIGRAGAMVLGRCPMAGDDGETIEVHVLGDPDLLSNHGLRLGDNARIATELIAGLAGKKRVIVDYSRRNWLVAAARHTHPDRTWADLARFFAFPFTLLWIGAGLTLGLFIWRGSLRFGPVTGGREALSATKSVMIGARARLMRLSGQDGAMLRAYAHARLASAAHHLLGPHRAGAAKPALFRFAERRDPALAARLRDTLARIEGLADHLPPEAAIAHVDELETLLEQLNDDT